MRNECTEKKIVGIFWGTNNLLMICSYLIVGFPCPYIVIIVFPFFVKKLIFFFVSRVCLGRVKGPSAGTQQTYETTISHWCVGDNRYFHCSPMSRSRPRSSSVMWLLRRLTEVTLGGKKRPFLSEALGHVFALMEHNNRATSPASAAVLFFKSRC